MLLKELVQFLALAEHTERFLKRDQERSHKGKRLSYIIKITHQPFVRQSARIHGGIRRQSLKQMITSDGKLRHHLMFSLSYLENSQKGYCPIHELFNKTT